MDYDELEKDFKTMSSSDFKQYIKQELKNYSGDDIEILRLEFWNIRSSYAEGNIEKAIKDYEKVISRLTGQCVVDGIVDSGIKIQENCKEGDWQSFRKTLYHEPFEENIKNCKNNQCACKKFDRQENLDFLSPQNLSKNFSTIYLVIGNKEYFDEKEFKHDFKIDMIDPVLTRTSVYYGKEDKNSDAPINLADLDNVKFAILPMVYNYSIDEKKKFIEYINNRSKQNRLSFFRKKYWNSKKHEINRASLESLHFTDKVEISSKGSYDTELPLDQDGNPIEIYSNRIDFFPQYKGSSKFNFEDSFNRLYVFSGDGDDERISRYSFRVGKTLSRKKKSKKSKNNETFIYLKWDSWQDNDDNKKRWRWYLRDYIEPDLFKIEIPQYYISDYGGDYNVTINGIPYSRIPKNSNVFNQGIKITTSDYRSTKAKLSNFIALEGDEILDSRIDIDRLSIANNIDFMNRTLNSDLIFVKADGKYLEDLEIVIEPIEDEKPQSNIIRNLVLGFLSILAINEAI